MLMNNDIEVLVIDDDQDVVDAYQHLLEIAGYKTSAITDSHHGTQHASQKLARRGRDRHVHARPERYRTAGEDQGSRSRAASYYDHRPWRLSRRLWMR